MLIAVFDADAYVAPNFLKLVLPVLAPEGIGAVQAQKKIYEQQKGFLLTVNLLNMLLTPIFKLDATLLAVLWNCAAMVN